MVRRIYTPELANSSLPLVRRITADIQTTARRIQSVVEHRGGPPRGDAGDDDELAALRDRFGELVAELQGLGIELKDPLTGLIDFRAQRDGVEVYLCWRLGEDAVEHWHTIDGGFAGRRPLSAF